MVIWGIVWGALLGGVVWGVWDISGALWGAAWGALAGLTLRHAVRTELARSQALVPKLAETAHTVPGAHVDPLAPVVQAVPPAPPPFPSAAPVFAASAEAEPAPRAVPAHADDMRVPSAQSIPVSVAATADDLTPEDWERSAADVPSAASGPMTPVAPITPRAPNAIESALQAARNWLLGGNTIVRVGLVVLFIGLSFLARFAATAGYFPVEFRLAGIGAVGLVLLGLGFAKRAGRPGFSLAMQGAGVAVIYLTVFAAFRLYEMLPVPLAFVLMAVVCALSCALALLQNSRALAVMAFAGGFAVPVLLSNGQGSHVGLFSYYTVLNLAILFIAYHRAWRVLNVVGFVSTFGVATAWGVLRYAPSAYATTQPFLIGFMVIYLAAAVLYARKLPTQLGRSVDSMLVFGTPLIGFGLQAGLVNHWEFGAAYSALCMAAVYLGVALVLVRSHLPNYRLLVEALLALGVGFATLAVPLALDGRWTSATWALEGLGAFWVGMRQARWMSRAFGLLLNVAAALLFLANLEPTVSAWPLVNANVLGALLVAGPLLMLAWWTRVPSPHSGSRWALRYEALQSALPGPLFAAGFIALCTAWGLEIYRFLPAVQSDLEPVPVWARSTQPLLLMLAVVLSSWAALRVGLRHQWAQALWPSRLSGVLMALILLSQIGNGYRAWMNPDWALWALALLVHYRMLHTHDLRTGGSTENRFFPLYQILHVGSVWLVTLLLADGLWLAIDRAELWGTAWASVVMLVSVMLGLVGLVAWAGRANQGAQRASFGWPLNPHAPAYYWLAAAPLAVLALLGAVLVALTSSGQTAPLPYVPVLNPTDLSIALALGSVWLWRRMLSQAKPAPLAARALLGPKMLMVLGAAAFVALNTVWLRIAHHFFSVPWNAESLYDSFVVQTGYSILWTLLALVIMVLAHRRAMRPLWLVGAGLLGLVVLKLVGVDLSNRGGAERIVAFIGVGVLMLVVGYFAPLPPAGAAPLPDAEAEAEPDLAAAPPPPTTPSAPDA